MVHVMSTAVHAPLPRGLIFMMITRIPVIFVLFSLMACGSDNYADLTVSEVETTPSEIRQPNFPLNYKRLDLRPEFTEQKLLRSPNNPQGIFVSENSDTSPSSDAIARKELINIGQRRQPFWARYVDEGPQTQDVVLLFHGIPAYSYLYRKVIGPIAQEKRVIAFDQLGQGFSSKSRNITYTFKQQLAFTEAFIHQLNLPEDTKFTVVVHDTGGPLGTSFAARHQDKVKAFVLFETIFGPIPDFNNLPPLPQYLRTPEGQRDIIDNNILLRNTLIFGHTIQPPSVVPYLANELKAQDKLLYSLPYLKRSHRRVLARWVREIPALNDPPSSPASTNLDLFLEQANYLQTTETPKLLMYAEPGVIVTKSVRKNLETVLNTNNSLTTVNLGKGFHFLQEDHGVRIGQEVRRWLRKLDGRAETPSAQFPYTSKFIEVLGSKMHYVDEGHGPVVLMLHGNPTSSYLWRNIIPFLSPKHRVIAPDLIGMGQSDQPDISYTFADHRRYLNAFIDALALKDITFVVHDWGSALGLDYAANNSANVKAVAFMEALLPPMFPATFDSLGPFTSEFFRLARDPILGPEFILEQNGFIEEVLPQNIMRTLSEVELEVYRSPYPTEESRRPLLAWPLEVPIEGEPANVVSVVENYSDWLRRSSTPKLHLYVSPGVLNPPELVDTLSSELPAYNAVFVGDGLHFIQEDHPEAIGLALADWLGQL